MITTTGRNIINNLTETGRAVFNGITETGQAVGAVGEGGGAVAGGSAGTSFALAMTVVGGGVSGGVASIARGAILSVSGGAVAGGATNMQAMSGLDGGGAIAGGSAPVSFAVVMPVSGGAVAGGAAPQSFESRILPLPAPPAGWQQTDPQPAPGASGVWGVTPAPVLPAAMQLPPIYAVTDYGITLAGVDITGQVERCTIDEGENAVFATCMLDVPVGMLINQSDAVVVTTAGVTRQFVVEEPSAHGPVRKVWCRSSAAVLDEPHAAEQNWNGWDTPHATAGQLGITLCGTTPLSWGLPDWTLPPRWELSGTPIEALQRLVSAVGGIVTSNPDGSLTARRRWPVRPPDLSAETPVAAINRDTALDISAKAEPGKGYGSVTVYGYDPATDLPDMEVEESAPVLGQPVHVRLFWRTPTPPPFSEFVTDGAAAKLSDGTQMITAEEVIFDQGKGSVRYPIKALHGFNWVGADQGNIWWLENGDSRELSTSDGPGRGIAEITYTTSYERWQLTGQTAPKCLFGVEVGQGQASAKVSYTSGGSLAPALSTPLVADTAGCIEAGTAFLDNARAVINVSADLPLTSAPIVPGATVAIDDPVTGVGGMGKVVSARITLESDKTTRVVEVALPC